jgi:hypothetical protein
VEKSAAKRSNDFAMMLAQLITGYGNRHCSEAPFPFVLKTHGILYHRERPAGRGQVKAAKLRLGSKYMHSPGGPECASAFALPEK